MVYGMGTVEGDPVNWFERALRNVHGYVAGVRPDQWDHPTPCTEWNVRDLVNHLVGNNLWFANALGGRPEEAEGEGSYPGGDLLGDDPLAVYDRSMEAAMRALQAPEALTRVYQISWGDVTGEVFTGEHFVDCFIHGWDLAKATGQDTTLEPDLVKAAYDILEPGNGQPTAESVYQFEVLDAPSDADLQTRLLARAGREA